MFILLRRIERWLHQEVFKVGWLATHDYQTTTILYYTFFLPGVFIHEIIYWLVAGALGVHAERSLKWPEQQEIGELKLNFVQVSNRAGVYRKAFISVAPMIFGLVFIWYIADRVFDIMTVVKTMSSGELADVASGFQLLIGAPLFWLWIYVIFTVANTMYPTVPKDLRGWRTIFLGIGAVVIVILLLGIGGNFVEAIQSPLSSIIGVMQTILFLLICIDILMVLILGTIEYTIERVTGHSATIQGGKLVTITRQEAIEEREKERERERRRAERQRNRAAATGPSSVYLLAFSIPGAPGDEPVTQVIEQTTEAPVEEKPEESKEEAPARLPLFGGLAEGDKQETEEKETEEDVKRRDSIAARINIPERRAPVPPPPQKKSEEKEVVKPIQPSLIGDDEDEKKETQVSKPPAASSFGKPLVRPKPTDAESETDKDTEEKPAASVAPRFGKPVDSDADGEAKEADEKPAVPAASRFGTRPQPTLFGKDKDTEQDDKPKAPAASRFGSTFGRPKPADTEGDTDVADEKPATPAASRFGSTFGRPKPADTDSDADEDGEKPATPAASHFGTRPQPTLFGEDKDTEQDDKPKAPAASRFGSTFGRPKPADTEGDTDVADEKPAVPAASRFGATLGRPKPADTDSDADEDGEKPATPAASRFGTRPQPTLFGEDKDTDEEKPAAPAASRFGATLGRPKPAESSEDIDDIQNDEDDAVVVPSVVVGRPATASRFADLDDEETDDEDEETPSKPAPFVPRTSRFSARADDDDEESPRTSRFGASPFARPADEESKRPATSLGSFSRRTPSTDDEDEDEDEEAVSSFLRQGRGKDAVSSLFSQLDEDEDEEDDKSSASPTSQFRRPTLGASPSRFGTSRPAPKPVSSFDEDEDEDEEGTSSASSSFRRPTLGASPSRFGASRPAPKPMSSFDEDKDDEDKDDELVYEDVEDEYIDDDEYYEDEDDDDEYYDYDD